MAVDHCFSIRGQGTVMTGTVLQGSLAINDTVEIPALKVSRWKKKTKKTTTPKENRFYALRLNVPAFLEGVTSEVFLKFISCLEAGKQEEGCTSRCRGCVSLMLGQDKQTGALASQEAGNLDQMRTLRQGSATLAAVVRFASWWQQIVKVSADIRVTFYQTFYLIL